MKRIFLPIAFLAGCLLLAGPASAQLVLGQYEDEAPLGTWNIFGAPSAQAVGMGGAQFARASDAAASLANPALLLTLPRLTASVSGSYAIASLFRFSFVNTGVVQSTGNPTAAVYGIDGGSVALRRGNWAFAVVAAAPESYGRPAIAVGSAGYELTFEQTGYLRLWHAGVARRLPAGWSLGLGVNYAAGRLDRTTVERAADSVRTVTITDDRHEAYRGLAFNGGLTWNAGKGLTAGLVLRSPFTKKGTGRSLLRYEVPEAGTDIRIGAEAGISYRQPWIVGAGLSWKISGAWALAADAAWFGWSRYAVTYFEEPLARSFRDIVRAGAGLEYLAPAPMFGRSARIPFRLGVSCDPQPVTSVRSSYLGVTFGTGLALRAWAVDVSGSFGQERGSGRSLKSGRIVLTVRYVVQE